MDVDAIVASTSDHPANTALVVGVLHGDRRSVHGYGAAAGGDTLFEIGSVSKVFTTALLSILAAAGSVNLDDPAAKLAPELAGLPPQITLRRLATHTAGLPRMPSDIFGSMLRDPGNPYAAYTTADLLQYLSKQPPSPRQVEACQISYSNLGVGLLGTLLARKLGVSYQAALAGQVCDPLGLKDTCVQLSPDQARRLAAPHSSGGKRGRSWDLPAFEGAGALKSTADDLLAFLAAHLGLAAGSLAQPLQACHAVQFETFAPPSLPERLAARLAGPDPVRERAREAIALGWTVGRLASGARVHWHHGATGAYRAFAGFVLERRAGVVVLANSGLKMQAGLLGITATDRVAFAILEQFAASA